MGKMCKTTLSKCVNIITSVVLVLFSAWCAVFHNLTLWAVNLNCSHARQLQWPAQPAVQGASRTPVLGTSPSLHWLQSWHHPTTLTRIPTLALFEPTTSKLLQKLHCSICVCMQNINQPSLILGYSHISPFCHLLKLQQGKFHFSVHVAIYKCRPCH